MGIGGRAMRGWVVLLLLAGSTWPAWAAKSVSVGQLESLLDKLRGKSDGKVAEELSDLELTERVSLARLAKWEALFPGSRSHEALEKLADLSALSEPPAGDVEPISAPDNETQERMLAVAAEYVKTTITRLPDLFATRETRYFLAAPSLEAVVAIGSKPLGPGSDAMRAPAIAIGSSELKSLHNTGSSSATVTYRNGREVYDATAAGGAKENEQAKGMATSGEFGPILAVVMGDAMRGEVEWLRWEQAASEPLAVFRYAVPVEQSNYEVGIPADGKTERVKTGYHGEIAIDPATGAILRVSAIAVLGPPHELVQAAVVVEYAPVAIGERSYICPARGVAFFRAPIHIAGKPQTGPAILVELEMNEVRFTQYHVFRSEARIVTNDGGAGDAAAGAPQPAPASPSDSSGTTPENHRP